MPKVKEFAQQVLARMHELYPELARADKLPRESERLGVLTRCEAEWSLDFLQTQLKKLTGDMRLDDEAAEKLPNPDAEVTEESLAFFVALLENRWGMIKGSNAIYNHTPESFANQSYVILAQELASHLGEGNNNHGNGKHAYDYLFPGTNIGKATFDQLTPEYLAHLLRGSINDPLEEFEGDKYVQRKVTDLPLHEFIWSDNRSGKADVDEFVPIVSIAALDKYLEIKRTTKASLIPHTCLDSKESLDPAECKRVASHSIEAGRYWRSITHLHKTDALAKVKEMRDQLINAATKPGFLPKYQYSNAKHKNSNNQSSKALLENGWLSRGFGVKNLYTLARLLDTRFIDKSDWKPFLQEIAKSKAYLEELVLSGLKWKTCTPIFLPENSTEFEDFVNTDAFYLDGDPEHNVAVLYIITELYNIFRTDYPELTGRFSSATNGIIGYTGEEKRAGAVVFQDFLLSNYRLNQLDDYLLAEHKVDAHAGVLGSGRLRILKDKAHSLGPKPSDRIENFRSNVRDLLLKSDSDVNRRGDDEEENWIEISKHSDPQVLQSLITATMGDKRLGFKSLVESYQIYKDKDQDDYERYNRATFFVLTLCYLKQRGTENSIKGTLGQFSNFGFLPRSLRPNDKIAKEKAVEELQRFLVKPDYRTNELFKYLNGVENGDIHKSVLEDKPGSDTNALVTQMQKICLPNYFQDAKKAAEAAKLEAEALAEQEGNGGLLSYLRLGGTN